MDNLQHWFIVGGVILFVLFIIGFVRGRRSGAPSDADPLAEAEVYIAYGRAHQAMRILEEGLKREPSRVDIAEKLKELKAAQKK